MQMDGYADEARGVFRGREERLALVNGTSRSCGQDGFVAVARKLGVRGVTKVTLWPAFAPHPHCTYILHDPYCACRGTAAS